MFVPTAVTVDDGMLKNTPILESTRLELFDGKRCFAVKHLLPTITSLKNREQQDKKLPGPLSESSSFSA